jgi:hypothetical protein
VGKELPRVSQEVEKLNCWALSRWVRHRLPASGAPQMTARCGQRLVGVVKGLAVRNTAAHREIAWVRQREIEGGHGVDSE